MRKVLATAIGTAVALGIVAGPAGAASTKTFHLFSKETSSKLYDASGTLVTDPHGAPSAGGYFVVTDNDYRGTHKKHSKKPIATDHLVCTFVADATGALQPTCDGQIALPGGLVFFDKVKTDFNAAAITFPIQGGTGKYAKATGGSLVSTFLGEDSSDSDLVVKVRF
jgi:hypothetical protein